MKNIIFLTALLILSTLRLNSYGQALSPYQCPPGPGLGDNRWGYKDKDTDEIKVPCTYQKVWNFSEQIEGLAMVRKNTTPTAVRATLKYGFVDENGKEVVPVKYDEINKFSEAIEGLAMVKADGKFGFIDETGKEVIPVKYSNPEFKFSEGLSVVKAGNSYGFIDKAGKEVIPCKFNYAEDFSKGLAHVILLKDDGFVDIAGDFYKGKKRDKADKIVAAKKAGGEYNALLAQIETAEQGAKRRPVNTERSTSDDRQPMIAENLPISDVSVNIPITGAKNDKTFAVIIANENYQTESKVEFARNDGEEFRKYCIQTLGLPESNVHFTADATLNNMRREINWLNQVAGAFQNEANIIFYYAGHGIPDESTKTSYLLPVDGFGSDVKTGYKLDKLYQTLGDLPAKSITVFMDACFSGANRKGEMMASARGVAIKSVQGAPKGNMVVFSAAQGDETAYPYREKGHGMFTYFLLKKLQESKGDATLKELGEYIETNVRQQSIVINSKSQTPVVTPSAALGDSWKTMKLK